MNVWGAVVRKRGWAHMNSLALTSAPCLTKCYKRNYDKGNLFSLQGRGVLEQEQSDALEVVGCCVLKRRPAAPESVSNRFQIGFKSVSNRLFQIGLKSV